MKYVIPSNIFYAIFLYICMHVCVYKYIRTQKYEDEVHFVLVHPTEFSSVKTVIIIVTAGSRKEEKET